MVATKVHHNHYGPGTVKEIDEAGGTIKVAFQKNTLSFPYPRSFHNFLTTDDADMLKALELQGITKSKGQAE
jgi:hypothetical protein